MRELLPMGSIVLLNNGQKRLMIYGRRQINAGTKKIYDYVGCLYPEGNIDPEHSYLFNHEDIDKLYFIGFQDTEEIEFNKFLEETFSKEKDAEAVK